MYPSFAVGATFSLRVYIARTKSIFSLISLLFEENKSGATTWVCAKCLTKTLHGNVALV